MNVLESKTNEQVYLEWLNDYLTIECMAEHYQVSSSNIESMIDKGRNERIEKFESEAYKKIWLPKN